MGLWKRDGEYSHLAYAFVDVGTGRQVSYLLGGQLEDPDFSLLGSYLRPNEADLLL
jgi:hypothetical protein